MAWFFRISFYPFSLVSSQPSQAHLVSRSIPFHSVQELRILNELTRSKTLLWHCTVKNKSHLRNKLARKYIHKMLIHYNTKILILWRHTPIQWIFIRIVHISSVFFALSVCVCVCCVHKRSTCLEPARSFIFALMKQQMKGKYREKMLHSFVHGPFHIPKTNYMQFVCCHGMVIVFIFVSYGSINVFLFYSVGKWRKKFFTFNVTSCIHM